MQLGFIAARKQPGRFKNNIDVQFFTAGSLDRAFNTLILAADDNVFVIITDLAFEFAVPNPI
jgi:hypothetical protein